MTAAWIYLIFHDVAAIGAGAYLAVNGHNWWAALCFLLAATTSVKQTLHKSDAG